MPIIGSVDSGCPSWGYHCVQPHQLDIICVASACLQGAHHLGVIVVFSISGVSSVLHQCGFRVPIIGFQCVSSISVVSSVVASVWIQGAHHWGISVSAASAWYHQGCVSVGFRLPIIGVSRCLQHQRSIIGGCVSVDSGRPSLGYPCVCSISLVPSVLHQCGVQGAHHWGISVSLASAWYHRCCISVGFRAPIIGVSVCHSASAWYHRCCVRVHFGCPSLGYHVVIQHQLGIIGVASVRIQGAHHWGISVSSASAWYHRWPRQCAFRVPIIGCISVSSASAGYQRCWRQCGFRVPTMGFISASAWNHLCCVSVGSGCPSLGYQCVISVVLAVLASVWT